MNAEQVKAIHEELAAKAASTFRAALRAVQQQRGTGETSTAITDAVAVSARMIAELSRERGLYMDFAQGKGFVMKFVKSEDVMQGFAGYSRVKASSDWIDMRSAWDLQLNPRPAGLRMPAAV